MAATFRTRASSSKPTAIFAWNRAAPETAPVLDFRVVLDDLTVRSATPGRDAVGEVSIHARVDAHTFTGRGAHTDVVRAAAQAYLHAVNKAAAARVLEEAHLESTANQWGV